MPCSAIVKIEYFQAHGVSRSLLGILLLCYLLTPPCTCIPIILGPLQNAEVGPLLYLNLAVTQTQSTRGRGLVVSGHSVVSVERAETGV